MAISVAVIGVGAIGRNHVRVYSETDQANLVAVADTNRDLAENIAAKFGVKAYDDYSEMLKTERPDAVSVSVPTAMHEEVATAALQAGAHVLVEKPIASTVREGERLIALADKLNRKLMVGHIVRFNPAIRALREKLQNNELGRIFQVVCRRVGPFPARIRDVGVVIDLAPHDIDVMRYLLGTSPERIYAEIEQRVHTEHEDLVFALLHFPNQVTGAIEINWLTPTKVREISVLGERGMFVVNDLTQDLFFYENAATNGELWPALGTIKGVSEGSMVRYSLDRYEPLRAELESFIEAIVQDLSIPISGQDGLEALRLALAMIESGRTNQVIKV
jgi:UDP-N-acetylglucosamine 3-dehydrogenase